MTTQTRSISKAQVALGVVSIGTVAFAVHTFYHAVSAFRKGDWYFSPIVICFSGFCVFLAYQGMFRQTARSVRWLFILVTAICWMFELYIVATVYVKMTGTEIFASAPDLKRAITHEMLQILPIVASMLAYQFTIRRILASLNLVDDRTLPQRIWSIKMSFGLVAFLIFSTSGNISAHSAAQGVSHHGPDLWDMLNCFGPIVSAVGIYKAGVYLATRRLTRSEPKKAALPAIV